MSESDRQLPICSLSSTLATHSVLHHHIGAMVGNRTCAYPGGGAGTLSFCRGIKYSVRLVLAVRIMQDCKLLPTSAFQDSET